MKKNYFAYHGPRNNENFDYTGGYGVKSEAKWKKIKNGDFVYVIQNIAKNNIFEFCGIFKIIGHYTNDDVGSKYHFRFELSDITNLKSPIAINESECSKLLPRKRSNLNWSNFKLHFCEQGATFRKELDRKVLQVLDSLLPEKTSFQFAEEISADEEKSFIEGAKQKITINRYERDLTARNECINFYGYKCKVCEFDFEKVYGSLGKNYIHVHHIVPISEIGRQYIVNPIKDLVPVCPNCHAMLHVTKQHVDIDELKEIIKNQ